MDNGGCAGADASNDDGANWVELGGLLAIGNTWLIPGCKPGIPTEELNATNKEMS